MPGRSQRSTKKLKKPGGRVTAEEVIGIARKKGVATAARESML
jgi:hypothetical protein